MPVQATPYTLSIGTGGVHGVYHPAGGAICRMLNKQRLQHGLRCIATSTGGSIYNLRAIRNAELTLGLAQSDWQYHAWRGSNRFAERGENTRLRALFALHAEPFTIIARADSDIRQLADLRNYRVNLGAPGSGQRGTMEILMDFLGWQLTDFELASELPAAEQMHALCNDKLDAIMITVGHPSDFVTQAAATCDIRLIPAEHPAIDELLAEYSYYRKARIPGGLYPGHPDDIPTFGVGATVVTSADLSDKMVYTLVRSVFDNLDEFKSLHPAFAPLQATEMVQDSLSAPLHAGADRYYRAHGIACYDPTPSEHNQFCQPGAFIPVSRSADVTTPPDPHESL